MFLDYPKMFKYEIIFKKNIPSNPLLAKKQILKYHENICVFYKTQPIFNPETKKRAEGNFRKNAKAEYEHQFQKMKIMKLKLVGCSHFY